MSSTSLIILLAALIAAVFAISRLKSHKISSQRNQALAARQAKIQSSLDRAGEILKNQNATIEEGEAAATQVLAELNSLNQDGSLSDLIAETEIFIADWRASKRPA